MIPKYLYHYTSIETLEKIITNKTIRFKNIGKLNDKNEGFVKAGFKNKKYNIHAYDAYVSCWTDIEEETVQMWQIYTNSQGIRIKMESSMFGDLNKLASNDIGYYPIVAIKEIALKNSISIKNIYGPIKIQYNKKKIDEKGFDISTVNKGTSKEFEMASVDYSYIGIAKDTALEYEKEWRYIIRPFVAIKANKDIIERIKYDDIDEYIDVPYVKNISEVMFAPEAKEIEKQNIIKLLHKNNINCEIKDSYLQTKFNKD